MAEVIGNTKIPKNKSSFVRRSMGGFETRNQSRMIVATIAAAMEIHVNGFPRTLAVNGTIEMCRPLCASRAAKDDPSELVDRVGVTLMAIGQGHVVCVR
jgi:hypothetical protein